MESKAKLLGHPVHQMLIPIPLGLLIVGTVVDLVHRAHGASWMPTVPFWNLGLGIVSGLVAAVFGLIDWTGIPAGTRAKRVGAMHGIGNVIVVGLFSLAVYLRWESYDHVAGTGALALEVLALAIGSVTAWLGGEMVDRLSVGVDPGANLNAPSSLSVKHLRAR